jgi:NitT/TauT family transport system substrate-binding protein
MNLKCIFLLILVISTSLINGCSSESPEPKVTIAINPWPGYEFLFLAQEKGFFKELNLDIELIEMASLADVQRVYSQGRAHGMASTMIEVVQAAGKAQEPISLVLIPDYSFGGDSIVSSRDIDSVASLKGKKVGTEIGSLGMYILAQALAKQDLSLSDVDIINVEQLDAEAAITSKQIDATVTYPPFSTAILKHDGFHEIFNTTSMPGDVIDTIAIRTEYLNSLPKDWKIRFFKAWDMALSFSQSNKEEAYKIMADREGISAADFADALTGLKLLSSKESFESIKHEATKKNISKVCQTLDHAKTIRFSCDNILSLIRL